MTPQLSLQLFMKRVKYFSKKIEHYLISLNVV